MRLDDYPSSAVDAMLEHRYGGLGEALSERPLTPESDSAKEWASGHVKPGATAKMLETRYAGVDDPSGRGR